MAVYPVNRLNLVLLYFESWNAEISKVFLLSIYGEISKWIEFANWTQKDLLSDPSIPVALDSDMSGKAFRRNWARLIPKVYHADHLYIIHFLWLFDFSSSIQYILNITVAVGELISELLKEHRKANSYPEVLFFGKRT